MSQDPNNPYNPYGPYGLPDTSLSHLRNALQRQVYNVRRSGPSTTPILAPCELHREIDRPATFGALSDDPRKFLWTPVPSLPGINGMHIANAYAAVNDLPEAITPSPRLRDTTFGYSPLMQMREIARPSGPLSSIASPLPPTSALPTSSNQMSSAPLSGPFTMAPRQLPPRGYHHQLYTPIKNYSNSFSREKKQDEGCVAAMKLPQSSEDLPREPCEVNQPSMQDHDLYQPSVGQHPQPGLQTHAKGHFQEQIQPHAQQLPPQQALDNAYAQAELHVQPHYEPDQQQCTQPQHQRHPQPCGRGQTKANANKIACDLCGRLKAAVGGEWYKSLKFMARDGFDYCAVSWRWEYAQRKKGVVINVEQVVKRNKALCLQNQAPMSYKDIIKLMKDTNTHMEFQNVHKVPYDHRIEHIEESNAGLGHQNHYGMPFKDRIQNISPYAEHMSEGSTGMDHQHYYSMPYSDRIQNYAPYAGHMSEGITGMGYQHRYAMSCNDRFQNSAPSTSLFDQQNLQRPRQLAEDMRRIRAPLGRMVEITGLPQPQQHHQYTEGFSNRFTTTDERGLKVSAAQQPHQYHEYRYNFSNQVAAPEANRDQPSPPKAPARQYRKRPQNGEDAAPQCTRRRPLRQPIESDKLILCSLCGRSKFERPNDWHNTRWKFQEGDPLGYCKNCYTKDMNERRRKLRAERRPN